MMLKFRLLFTLFFIGFSCVINAQQQDTVALDYVENDALIIKSNSNIETFKVKDSTHSPRLAALYSAVIPGLGQFYNEKYWKIPIVYALGAFTASQIKNNHQKYLLFRNVLFNLEDGNPENDNEIAEYADRFGSTIDRQVDRFKRDRDYWIILSGVFYVLNIVDATVDAHLREFNINENLSMKIKPAVISTPYSNMQAAVMFNFNIKGKNTN